MPVGGKMGQDTLMRYDTTVDVLTHVALALELWHSAFLFVARGRRSDDQTQLAANFEADN